MPQILIFSEKDEIAAELLAGALALKEGLAANISAAIIGKDAGNKSSQYFSAGAEKVYVSSDANLTDVYADTYAEALAQIANNNGVDIILIGSTKMGKEIAPRLAQKLGAGCLTDAIGLEVKDKELLVKRYGLGGNTVASDVIQTPKKVISVMPRTFVPLPKQTGQGTVVNLTLNIGASKCKILEKRQKTATAVNIETAEKLVCVGRGLNKKEDLPMITALATAMKAELGCTRPLAYDLQWLPEERSVGLSGKKCKPALCVTIGVSGQIQYAVGIRDSKIIVAINKDKNALIFKMADYGIVGDLYDIVPKLTKLLSA